MREQDIETRRVLVNGISTRYYEYGEGQPVLLVAGAASSARDWFPVMLDLGDTCRVIAPVLPGFSGTGSLPDVKPVHMAAFLADLLDALDIDSVIAIGHSYGGCVAAELAIAHPELVRRLALVDANGLGRAAHPAAIALAILPPRVADLLSALASLPGSEVVLACSTLLLLRQPWRVPLGTWLAQARLARSQKSLRTSLEIFRECGDIIGQRPDTLVVDRLARLRTPVLIVWGDTDTLLPAWQGRAAARRLPAGRFVLLTGAGHVSYLDSHTDFMDAIGPFVRDSADRVP
ncbi:alpha/beta fold hydrolase [Streptomyces achromogenes]|uniref:alpha/beta fold hydrolase n=1 Tax=Streptomyces achromogenes TaxID=67255 RepID=UPI0004C6D14B|nr:alpha/beta hydrolase [Streptomyces achromogenes]